MAVCKAFNLRGGDYTIPNSLNNSIKRLFKCYKMLKSFSMCLTNRYATLANAKLVSEASVTAPHLKTLNTVKHQALYNR